MTTPTKPNAPSYERNREPILDILQQYLTQPASVLEVGSGSGQHAVYLAERLPHLIWQASDVQEKLEGIQLWREESGLTNLPEPIELDVSQHQWQPERFDVVFTANTLHIMAWHLVEKLIQGVTETLNNGGQFIIYGPFNYDGAYTSESNQRFDVWLKEQDPVSAIRDFEAVMECAQAQNLQLIEDIEMPANNRMLIFQLV